MKEAKKKMTPGYAQRTTAKLVFPEKAMGFMIGKRGFFVQELNELYKVTVKVLTNEYRMKEIKKNDSVVIISGVLGKVIAACGDILNRMNQYYQKNDKNYAEYSLKMIISSANVSKLIG